MGTSNTAAEFGRKVRSLGTVTETRARDAVHAGALTTKTLILAEATTKGLSPTSRIAGGRWGVSYNVAGTTNPTALVRVKGAVHLVESDTKAHPIGRRTRGRRAGTALKLADGSFRRVVNHPGTQGKGFFKAARDKAEVAVPIVMARGVLAGWRAVLK